MGRRSKSNTPIYIGNQCNNCDLFVANRSIPTGSETGENKVLILNDITSAADITNQSAFTGRRSIIIRKLVSLYELDNAVVYNNLILCQCTAFNSFVYSRCKDNLYEFISILKPKIIVTIGKTVYDHFIGGDAYKQRLYKPFLVGKVIIFPIEHPFKLITVNQSYARYITAFNRISELYSVINPYYKQVHYDTSKHMDL